MANIKITKTLNIDVFQVMNSAKRITARFTSKIDKVPAANGQPEKQLTNDIVNLSFSDLDLKNLDTNKPVKITIEQ